MCSNHHDLPEMAVIESLPLSCLLSCYGRTTRHENSCSARISEKVAFSPKRFRDALPEPSRLAAAPANHYIASSLPAKPQSVRTHSQKAFATTRGQRSIGCRCSPKTLQDKPSDSIRGQGAPR